MQYFHLFSSFLVHEDYSVFQELVDEGKKRLHSLQLKIESCIQSAKTRPGADRGSDHQLLTAKFRLKLKKVGKNHQVSQVRLKVTNRFKGLNTVNSMPEELVARSKYCTGGSGQNHSKDKEKMAKWLSEEALQIAEERREVKSKGERER